MRAGRPCTWSSVLLSSPRPRAASVKGLSSPPISFVIVDGTGTLSAKRKGSHLDIFFTLFMRNLCGQPRIFEYILKYISPSSISALSGTARNSNLNFLVLQSVAHFIAFGSAQRRLASALKRPFFSYFKPPSRICLTF